MPQCRHDPEMEVLEQSVVCLQWIYDHLCPKMIQGHQQTLTDCWVSTTHCHNNYRPQYYSPRMQKLAVQAQPELTSHRNYVTPQMAWAQSAPPPVLPRRHYGIRPSHRTARCSEECSSRHLKPTTVQSASDLESGRPDCEISLPAHLQMRCIRLSAPLIAA